jgi:hypothetical protein
MPLTLDDLNRLTFKYLGRNMKVRRRKFESHRHYCFRVSAAIFQKYLDDSDSGVKLLSQRKKR